MLWFSIFKRRFSWPHEGVVRIDLPWFWGSCINHIRVVAKYLYLYMVGKAVSWIEPGEILLSSIVLPA